MKNELYKFIKHLESCGLMTLSSNEIDYEKVIYEYMNYDTDNSGTVIMITKKKREFFVYKK